MAGVEDCSFDFVHSSHCLEHLKDPREGLRNWMRVLRPEGHLVVTVPDEDLYEQGVFPSTFNGDHRWTFTICKSSSWSTRSLNVVDLVRELGEDAELIRLELLTATYRFDLPRYDQTLSPVAECGIEFVVRKRPRSEIAAGGRLPRAEQPATGEVRIHLNQYRDDLASLKESNREKPPFGNDGPV
jgi:SAM-dependent methyltransferase